MPREIGGAFGAAQFLGGQRYLKLVGRLIVSLWLEAQSNFPQCWQTLGRLSQMTVGSFWWWHFARPRWSFLIICNVFFHTVCSMRFHSVSQFRFWRRVVFVLVLSYPFFVLRLVSPHPQNEYPGQVQFIKTSTDLSDTDILLPQVDDSGLCWFSTAVSFFFIFDFSFHTTSVFG